MCSMRINGLVPSTPSPIADTSGTQQSALVDGIAITLLGNDRLQTCPRAERRRWLRAIRIALAICASLALVLFLLRIPDGIGRALFAVCAVFSVLLFACLLLTFASDRECKEEQPPPPCIPAPAQASNEHCRLVASACSNEDSAV